MESMKAILLISLVTLLEAGCGEFRALPPTSSAEQSTSWGRGQSLPDGMDPNFQVKMVLNVSVNSNNISSPISENSTVKFRISYDPSGAIPSCGKDCGKSVVLSIFAPINYAKLLRESDGAVVGATNCSDVATSLSNGCDIRFGYQAEQEFSKIVGTQLCGSQDFTYQLIPATYQAVLGFPDGSERIQKFTAPSLCDRSPASISQNNDHQVWWFGCAVILGLCILTWIVLLKLRSREP
jgi:hypothetical protein